MNDANKMIAIAEDSRFLSRFQELLTEKPIWLQREGPTMLTKYLYLGSMHDAKDVPKLKRLGITHIINCTAKSTDNTPLYVNEPDIWVYHPIQAEDNDNYDIMQHFGNVQTIIAHARKFGGKVLIHCEMGVNRSCALCIAHIMVEYEADLLHVFAMMKRLRGICVVNMGFQRQLIHFARSRHLLYPKESTR